jgi:hypothetical protein
MGWSKKDREPRKKKNYSKGRNRKGKVSSSENKITRYSEECGFQWDGIMMGEDQDFKVRKNEEENDCTGCLLLDTHPLVERKKKGEDPS